MEFGSVLNILSILIPRSLYKYQQEQSQDSNDDYRGPSEKQPRLDPSIGVGRLEATLRSQPTGREEGEGLSQGESVSVTFEEEQVLSNNY